MGNGKTADASSADGGYPDSGEAGRLDATTRSDCRVVVERKKSGPNEIQIDSKVGAFFGESLRATVEDMLDTFGAESVRLVLEDRGALPFVISARMEAALRRAGFRRNKGVSEPSSAAPAPTERTRVRRSRLYLPGNEPKFMVNAGLHRPDAVILDLEDSVHPSEKDAARIVVRNALRTIDFLEAERMVRINQLPLGLQDLDELIAESPDLILIPKVERASDVVQVAQHIQAIQKKRGTSRSVWLMPILESALGIENAFEIAAADESVVALTIGLEDYTADLGVQKTKEGTESLFARMRLVNAARGAHRQAIDSVFGDVGDMDGLSAWAKASRALGFEGMGCIHPRQIEPIHRAYAPSAEEIEKARKIVAAFAEASDKGLSVVSLGSKMIDPPVVLRAQRLLENARRTGLLVDEA